MSEQALKLIRENKKTKSKKLDLGRCGLTTLDEIAEELFSCVWLEELILSNERWDWEKIEWISSSNKGNKNYLSNLSISISRLQNLKKLKAGGDYDVKWSISDISVLERLTGLRSLDLSYNTISDISYLERLTGLQSLDLSYNTISDISYLERLTGLQSLNLSYNTISDISYLERLTGLQSLNLRYNTISDISYLEKLTGLQSLNLGFNQVSDISVLEKLVGLQSLDISHNKISDISIVTRFSKLKFLRIDIVNIKPALIKYIDLINYKELPIIIETNLEVTISGDPIFPPIEIMADGDKAIIAYFNSLKQGSKPLNEVKILLVGDGEAGKTSLVKKLCNKSFNEKEPQTHGIQIQDSQIAIREEEIKVHYWDFGGQEIMHATHQFFLTQDCVYILVLDGRRDERPEYWLKHIATFGGNAPILVVMNKCENNRSYDVEQKDLNSKFSNIKGYYKVSCKTGEGFDTFKNALQDEIYNLPFRETPFSPLWSMVKNKLTGMDEPYISYKTYYEKCENIGVADKDEQQTLLGYLNKLGIVLNFESLKQYDTQVLNPLWLTQAVYRIINSPIVADQVGEFNESQLFEILNDPYFDKLELKEEPNNPLLEKIKKWFGWGIDNSSTKKKGKINYPEDIQLSFIAKVMEQFELSYSLGDGRYIIPDLLPVEIPGQIEYKDYKLSFVVDFYFLPPSLLPRFMVQTNKNIKGAIRWRSGVVLNAEGVYNAEAIVRADKENKRIEIFLKGEELRELLVYIRSVLQGLYSSYEGMKEPNRIKEWLFLPDSRVEVELEEIDGLRKHNIKDYSSGKTGKQYKVDDIIQSIESPAYSFNKEATPIKIFISYSRTKRRMREELVTKLFPLTKSKDNFIELWIDEKSINPGGNWKDEIDEGLNNSEIVICLLSDEYFASEFCMYEFNKASENSKIVYPVLLNTCAWKDSEFKHINGYFIEIEPITKSKRPAHWQQVYEAIKKLVNNK